MDAVVKALVEGLLSHGLPGIFVAGLGYWVWKLQERLNIVQEQRVQDAYRLAQIANACATAVERNTAALKALLEG